MLRQLLAGRGDLHMIATEYANERPRLCRAPATINRALAAIAAAHRAAMTPAACHVNVAVSRSSRSSTREHAFGLRCA